MHFPNRREIRRDNFSFGLSVIASELKLSILIFSLVTFGVVMVTSASSAISEHYHHSFSYFTEKQILFDLLGFLFLYISIYIPIRVWYQIAPFLFFLGIILLIIILVPFLGHRVKGSSRWINLGFFRLQASEPFKLFFILFLSRYLTRNRDQIKNNLSALILPLIFLIITSLLLLMEPDYGATAIIVILTIFLLFLAEANNYYLTIFLILAATILFLAAISSPYRVLRLATFFNHSSNHQGSSYQISQALVGLSRGKFAGVGLGMGLQKLGRLPEPHTDFIFSVIGEELGFFGIICLIGLYFILIVEILRTGWQSGKLKGALFGRYLAYGIGLWLALQAGINIGVNLGLLPTKGLSLPLISYGGSSSITTLVAFGILLRIRFETRSFNQISGRRPSFR